MRSVMAAAMVAMVLVGVISARADGPALTIYSDSHAVVRQTVPLDLQAGVNTVNVTDVAAAIDPESVMLRDPSGGAAFRILEQSHVAAPRTQAYLLSLFEGQEIDFSVADQKDANRWSVARGTVVGSGYVPDGKDDWPLIEMDGRLRLGVPGTPLYPISRTHAALRPRLQWRIAAAAPARFDAELSYMTGGISWSASYSAIAPPEGDTLELVGWASVKNNSGREFADARVKLMVGEVIKSRGGGTGGGMFQQGQSDYESEGPAVPVTERSFEDFHVYTLTDPFTLHEREVKQVEFVRATGVQTRRYYVYSGVDLGEWSGQDLRQLRDRPEFGATCNPKVWVMRELKNSAANRLGLPLPAGKMRFYCTDAVDGRPEFVGENLIDHTPQDERLRIYTGNAFDLVGERKQLEFKADSERECVDERIEVTLRNHKKEPVEILVVEHLYRWANWEIREASTEYTKKDAQRIEFRVTVPPDGEQAVMYFVHYWW